MATMSKLKRDPTGLAAVEGRDAVFRAAMISATGGDITTSKTMRNSKGKGLPKAPDVHPHHSYNAPRSHRAK